VNREGFNSSRICIGFLNSVPILNFIVYTFLQRIDTMFNLGCIGVVWLVISWVSSFPYVLCLC